MSAERNTINNEYQIAKVDVFGDSEKETHFVKVTKGDRVYNISFQFMAGKQVIGPENEQIAVVKQNGGTIFLSQDLDILA